MASKIQLRRDTATNWTSVNPVLSIGEIGIELDTSQYKIGDGTTAWASLAYKGLNGEQGIQGEPGADSTVPGPQGEQGLQGGQGIQGEQGIQGVPGSDANVTKANVEAVLTGEISSHTHAGGSSPQFPVGYVLISKVNTNPATFLGYGTWEPFGAGRVLVGLDSGDADFDTLEETGGSKTNTPSAHAGTAVDNHTNVAVPGTATTAVKIGTSASSAAAQSHTHTIATITHGVTQPSAHSALSVVQPYFVVYFWERTA